MVLLSMLGTLQGLQAQDLEGEKVPFFLNSVDEQDDGKLQIISPSISGGYLYTSDKADVVVFGKVDTKTISVLSINGEIVKLAETGVFTSSVHLHKGPNQVKMITLDKDNELKEYLYQFNFHPPVQTLSDRIRAESHYYALIIGVDRYEAEGLPSLNNPIRDAEHLKTTLVKNYTFEPENVSLLMNATRSEIIRELDELTRKVSDKDNLLIFYAGHGTWDELANNGYWLPSDARLGDKTNWVRNSTVVDYLKEIHSRHTLLIADACFGGSIFQTRSSFGNTNMAYEKLYDQPSRKAMTSGQLTEVPDKSYFTYYLIDRLNSNSDTYLSSTELFSSFRNAAINNSDVIPEYGEIRNVGDQGGEFIFLKRE